MKTFLYFLVATFLFVSCQNKEELRSLEKMQNRTIDNLEMRNESRMNWFLVQEAQHGERIELYFDAVVSIRNRTKFLCDSFQMIMEDSTIRSGDLDFAMKQLERHITFMQNIVNNGNKYNYYTLSKEDISTHKKHFRLSFLQIKQEILIQEYNYLGEIMNMTSSYSGGWWSSVSSTYMEYRDSSYLNLHFPALKDAQYYVTVDTLLKDGKAIETDYFPEPVMIQSRIKLFELDKGQYQIKGRVVRLLGNGRLNNIPFENEFEIE